MLAHLKSEHALRGMNNSKSMKGKQGKPIQYPGMH